MGKLPGLLTALSLAVAFPAFAQTAHGHDHAAKPGAAAGKLADAEVRKVDKDARRITLKHGPLADLDMPAMTMVFQVKDAAMLDMVKQGDKVKFAAEKVNGAYTVTQIEAAK